MKNEMKGNKKALRILGLNEPTLSFSGPVRVVFIRYIGPGSRESRRGR